MKHRQAAVGQDFLVSVIGGKRTLALLGFRAVVFLGQPPQRSAFVPRAVSHSLCGTPRLRPSERDVVPRSAWQMEGPVIGSVYHPPKPGFPFLAAIFSGGELIQTEVFPTESDASVWVSEMLERIRANLAQRDSENS